MKKVAWSVDDDKNLREALCMMLNLMGFETRAFSGARAAAAALMAGDRPDILFLDINMPEVSGIEFLKVIRGKSIWDDIPVLIASSESAEIQVEVAIRLGADGYVFKPVNFEELQMAIDSAVKRRKLTSSG